MDRSGLSLTTVVMGWAITWQTMTGICSPEILTFGSKAMKVSISQTYKKTWRYSKKVKAKLNWPSITLSSCRKKAIKNFLGRRTGSLWSVWDYMKRHNLHPQKKSSKFSNMLQTACFAKYFAKLCVSACVFGTVLSERQRVVMPNWFDFVFLVCFFSVYSSFLEAINKTYWWNYIWKHLHFTFSDEKVGIVLHIVWLPKLYLVIYFVAGKRK